jgi:hypothetical protein
MVKEQKMVREREKGGKLMLSEQTCSHDNGIREWNPRKVLIS